MSIGSWVYEKPSAIKYNYGRQWVLWYGRLNEFNQLNSWITNFLVYLGYNRMMGIFRSGGIKASRRETIRGLSLRVKLIPIFYGLYLWWCCWRLAFQKSIDIKGARRWDGSMFALIINEVWITVWEWVGSIKIIIIMQDINRVCCNTELV